MFFVLVFGFDLFLGFFFFFFFWFLDFLGGGGFFGGAGGAQGVGVGKGPGGKGGGVGVGGGGGGVEWGAGRRSDEGTHHSTPPLLLPSPHHACSVSLPSSCWPVTLTSP